MATEVRPLRRVGHGHWKSHDDQWTFLRHESDPFPKRWFAYFGKEDPDPMNVGLGHVTLRETVEWAEEVDPYG